MRALDFGAVRVSRVVEAEGPSFLAAFLIPDSNDDALAAERSWIEPRFYDRDSGRLIMSLHSYLVRTPHHTILVDTCVGNDKERPSTPRWHRQETPWLDRLAACVAPEEVDFVLCTHLHVDHVGWNTRLSGGRWVPTFPNARYLFHKAELAFWEGEADGGSGAGDGCFADSVLPVIEAGRAVLVEGDHAIDDTLWLEPSPGHTPGHVCLHLAAGGRRAVFSGDVMHHPVQCAYPEWNSRFCVDPALSRATRMRFVDRHAETDTVILAAHFAAPTAGRIVDGGARRRFAAGDARR
jgi:glyoxylase-like metal-dependent hydrolase (beta-lactamase superfamily II)